MIGASSANLVPEEEADRAVDFFSGLPVVFSQRLQYPLIKEYTLNYSKIPNMI